MSDVTEPNASASASEGNQRLPRRRTVIKGAAWSVPILAAAVAAPAHASSCAPGERQITATSDSYAWTTIEIPACAREIRYVVRGGGGGASGAYGGFGAVATGTITPTGSSMTLYLIAGQGGWRRGSTKLDVRPRGYGDGGLGGDRYDFNGSGVWAVDAGYGGAGSAILLGSTEASPALVVAGGGGGGANSMNSGGDGGVLIKAFPGGGGHAGATAEAGAAGTVEGGGFAGGGGGATLSNVGAGGVPSGPYMNIVGYSGSGRNGGSGDEMRYGASGGKTGATSGGGGGGYFGGGGGSAVWYEDLHAGAGAGGGAGSSFINQTAAPGTIDSSWLDNSGDGVPGMVSVSWR
ncbi:hypothetical protein [Microbacterium esteraromaticum]|uniref:hypothetical protein n=1 Tax=Microbacterium esteraromaticum TaxID=57043 RepID=UPI00195A4F3F|nr:hypothetical protein [Microbacterium esteraromaticum]MBM7466540.1 hypothetical protein [Microbacterium esteraromaticum]